MKSFDKSAKGVEDTSFSYNCFIIFKNVDFPEPPIPVVIKNTSSSGWNNIIYNITSCLSSKGKGSPLGI